MAIRPSSILAFGAFLALAGGCVSSSPNEVLAHGTDAEIEAAALRAAKDDMAAGHPRICYAGTFASSPVGVSDYSLVDRLPHYPLPCGCGDPLALPAEKFAAVYNAEIVQYLQDKAATK